MGMNERFISMAIHHTSMAQAKPDPKDVEQAVDVLYALADWLEETEPYATDAISKLRNGASEAGYYQNEGD